MMKGDHGPTKLLHTLTWGAFDHASHAPQVRTCNYYHLYKIKYIINDMSANLDHFYK